MEGLTVVWVTLLCHRIRIVTNQRRFRAQEFLRLPTQWITTSDAGLGGEPGWTELFGRQGQPHIQDDTKATRGYSHHSQHVQLAAQTRIAEDRTRSLSQYGGRQCSSPSNMHMRMCIGLLILVSRGIAIFLGTRCTPKLPDGPNKRPAYGRTGFLIIGILSVEIMISRKEI